MKVNISKCNFLFLCLLVSCTTGNSVLQEGERPNIVWITCEDISPYLGCYGFEQAQTPNLDKLASRGILFNHAYSNAPVCAVARSTILTGMYASTIGTHHMRSRTVLPELIPAYPKILRESGYYCTNNSKKDYNSNFENDTTIWDESSKNAHYRNRKSDQPFFAVFNITVTHESQLDSNRIQNYVENKLIPNEPRVNANEINLPPYHPDLPEIRNDWARFHDLITLMDSLAGNILAELEEEGEADNTIVFFYSDHGGQLSRSKRYIYNVGTQVPMIVYLPEKWQHLSKIKPGGIDESMVSFVDLGKTLLSITKSKVPDIMQGRVFLGDAPDDAPDFVYFYRDRMGERYDFSRAITDGEYYFIRNFKPHRPLGRDSRYGYQVQANWRAWEDYFASGKCNNTQSQFYLPKETIELFHTVEDPWHVNNLVSNPGFDRRKDKLSRELDQWMIETRDIGLIPEPMFHELAGTNKKYSTIFEFAQSDDYPIEHILEAAKYSSEGKMDYLDKYLDYIMHSDPIVRYWGAYGLFLIKSTHSSVESALERMATTDMYSANRIIAAQSLAVCGQPELAFDIIMNEAQMTENSYVLLQAIHAFQYSHTDRFLSLEDWKYFKRKQFSENDLAAILGYPNRIIDDAISLWPEKRVVD